RRGAGAARGARRDRDQAHLRRDGADRRQARPDRCTAHRWRRRRHRRALLPVLRRAARGAHRRAAASYFLFAMLLNSGAPFILQSMLTSGVDKVATSTLDACKDLPIAIT